MRRDIVVAVDGSDVGTAAARWAAVEARRREVPLQIVHVMPADGQQTWEAGQQVLTEALAVSRLVAPGIELEPDLRFGDVVTELLDVASTGRTLVLGSRDHGLVSGMMLGSVSRQLIGRAPGAIIVRGVSSVEHGEIAVGFDGSQEARRAMEYAFEEATLREARVRVVLAWSMVGSEVASTDAAWAARVKQDYLDHELATWSQRYPGVEVEGRVHRARAVTALSEASEHADLLVIASRGRGPARSAMLGSVGHGVLTHARCPVVVVGAERRVTA